MFRGRTAAMAASVIAVGVLGLTGCTSGSDGGSEESPDAAGTAGTAGTAVSTASPSSASPPVSPTPSPSKSAPASASASASKSPSPVPVTGPKQKLVTMTVTGGFAGINQKVVLRGDGTVLADDKGDPEVRRTSAAQFTELRTLLGDPALADVPEFTIDTGAADMFQYALQFNGRTVMTDRSADQPALDRLIDALSEWLPGH
ncbi:hypothetical protein [Streptomyces liliifuscus]|uniref:Lipoprotein n=1 Tax=Streptomyces liliifuscus TaxID=2797636 RepID=A0A7T7L300_9ACTN|nr:hypothetical protein [Streptomyces liliifuscus]QQM45439.1 hypothetical protein JEQ17_42540 [Streptomyces liliifuscus]